MAKDVLSGRVLGHFRLLEEIGSGGMGVVYRAHDERLDRDVAVKVLPAGALSDEAARRQFRQEAQALAKLNHPNIATIYDFDSSEDADFLVMELLSGQTLHDKLLRGPLPQAAVVPVAIQIAGGLAAAHAQGILHRDLKPGNLGLTTDGRVKILDFGLAKLLQPGPNDATQTQTGAGWIKGTIPYMAPEQLRGEKADVRTDVYSAGAVLYEMATGKRPHPEEGPLLINAILNQSPKPPSTHNRHMGPGLEAVIVKAMDHNPSLRYQSARELLVDLERMQSAVVPVAAQQASRRQLRKRAIWAGLVVAALLIAIGAWQFTRHLQVRPQEAVRRPLILVGEFENRTGEPILDNTLSEMFSSTLQQSRVLAVFPASRLADVLRRMGRPPLERIKEDVGREICQREGLAGVLLGSITKLGSKYVLIARVEAPSGADIVTAEKSAASVDDIPAQVDAIADTLRRTLGESLQSLKENSVPLAQVTSSSLEAVRYYTLGKQSLYNGDPRQAMMMFSKAVELDPKFAMAHEYLGITYWHLNDSGNEEKQLREAALLADRVSEPERVKIMGEYYRVIMDYQKACAYLQILSQLQPADPVPYVSLGVCSAEQFDFAAAVGFTEKALQFVPQSRVRINLASQLFRKGETAKALEEAEQFKSEYANDLFAQITLARIYFGLGRLDGARQTFEHMVQGGGNSEIEARLSLADLDLATGRYREAQQELQAGRLAAEKEHNAFFVQKARIALALALASDESSKARAGGAIAGTEPSSGSPPVNFRLGTAYARSGQLRAANKMARALDTLAGERDIPAIQALRYLLAAEIALAEHKPTEALVVAQKAVAYYNSPLAVETLAGCYQSAGKDQEAAQQYELVLARSNERIESFDAPAFHNVVEDEYQLGVLDQKLGQAESARTHLQRFLGYWSQADPGLPMYQNAQRLLRALPTGTPTAAR
ncbi:MAG: protein kinase [Terriglobales bacterium]